MVDAALCCRPADGHSLRCAMQGGQVITDGVGRGSEVEDDVDPAAAREFLKNPSKLLELDLPFIQELKQCATRTPEAVVDFFSYRNNSAIFTVTP